MSTEVGSLQANLTLDLSDFRAGMSEAANLAAQLGGQLQTALNGNTGFDRMTREVMELVAQIQLLSGEMSNLQAAMNTVTSADLFAQMRTHTAALPNEIASITSAISAANTAAAQLANTFTTVQTNITGAATAAQALNLGNLAAEISAINFANPLDQLTQMQMVLSQLIAQIQQLSTIDLSTGEITGSEDQMPAFYNLYTTVQQIAAELENCIALLQQCAAATDDWATQMGRVRSNAERVAASLSGASMSMRDMRGGSSGAASGTRNFANQADRAQKHLQSAKGYALSVKGILGGIVISQAFYSLLNIMEQLVHGAVEFSQNMQDASVAFEYLMAGSQTSSGAFLNALKDIALKSPLDTTDLTASSRKLMAMGFSAEATIPALSILTDTAAVFSNKAGDMAEMIDHISLAFGQMLASGKVSAQELRQLYNAGLPIYDLLSEGLGISKEMAKNIGHYNVDSATAVFAVLDQLQKRYGGAAEAMADTMSGSLEVIRESIQQLLSYGWADIFDDLTQKVNKLASYMKALVKITQAYGPGGLFQAIFPESTWGVLRQLIGGFKMLVIAAKQLGSVLKEAFGGGLWIIVNIGAQVIPIIGAIANTILVMVRAALAASPVLRILLSTIAALAISTFIAKGIAILGKAIWTLTGAKAAAAALGSLAKMLVSLTGLPLKVVVPLMAVSAALLAIVASSEKARAALAKFFGAIGQKVGNFVQSLNIGFDPNDIMMPEFEAPDTSDFSGGLKDLTEGMEELEDATNKAGKAAKKNLQSFDEVYTIQPKDDKDSIGALDGMLDALKGLDNLDYSHLFDWTGDWATDWGNLSASLDDLGDLATDIFGDMSALADNLWQSLADALGANPEVTGGLLGAAIGAALGALVGHPKIGAALGAIAGALVGSFWKLVAEKFNLPIESATRATIASGIGTLLGTVIGTAFGGKAGAVIGGVIGTALGGIGQMAWEYLHDSFALSAEAGWANVAEGAFNGLLKALSAKFGLVTSDAYKLGFSFFTNSGVSLKAGLKAGLLNTLASIAFGFFTDWLVGSIASAITDSEDDIARAENWGSWGGSILGAIGSIIGTIIAPGVGTLIGGLLGQLAGALGGGALGLWWDEITAWWDDVWNDTCVFFGETIPSFFSGIGDTIGSAFSSAWDGVNVFFTETLPQRWASFKDSLGTFFTETVPDVLYDAGYAIGNALGTAAVEFDEFCHVTVPQMWEDFVNSLDKFFNETIPQAWDKFVNSLETFLTVTIPNAWNNFTQKLEEFFTRTVDSIKTFFTQTIPDAWNNFVARLKTFLTVTIPAAWEDFKRRLSEFFTSILNSCTTFFTVTLPAKWTSFVEKVKQLGRNIIDGILNGLKSGVGAIWDWISSFARGFIDGIKDAFSIHSPSKFTTWCGEMLMSGLANGLTDNTREAIAAAMNAAKQITEAIQPEEAESTNLLGNMSTSTDGALMALTSWSATFVNTLATTFDAVAAMFDALTDRLNASTAGIASVPTAIDAKMGSLRAVDSMGNTPTAPPGAPAVMQVIADLTEAAISKLSGSIADRLYEYLAPLFANLSSDEQQQAIAYVGTLIADDAGLKELERKLKIIRISEGRRG